MNEEQAIELLNEIDTTWRESWDSPWEALEALGLDALRADDDGYEELNFND
jgi:hypothetical protein